MIKQILALFLLTTALMAQNGGQFALTESAIANGGGNSSAGLFDTRGTAGQTVAGGTISVGQ